MIPYEPTQLTSAVAAVCPEIQQRVLNMTEEPNERALWWELSMCLLSSQVPFSLAAGAADAIDRAGVLLTDVSQAVLEGQLSSILRSPLMIGGRQRSYRFPTSRAAQLAATYNSVRNKAGNLRMLVNCFKDPESARDWFITYAPGLGAKQASMFLRNVGVSYDLAILDRHVLSYMDLIGIFQLRQTSPSGLKQYLSAEAVLRGHADELACSVGVMDWAIWIVMRVARRQGGL